MQYGRNIIVTALTSAALTLTSCGGGAKDASQVANAVTVKEMTIGAEAYANNDYSYSGTIEAGTETALSFASGGTISQIFVKVGDMVSSGQLIATVDQTNLKSNYEMTRANRVQAQDAYDRYKQVYDKGSLPEISWVEVQSKLQEAVSAENIAQKHLRDCNLYAPHGGIISEKDAEVGQNVAPGAPVAKLVTTKMLNVKIYVPESEMGNVNIGLQADIRVRAIEGGDFRGLVSEKSVVADPVSRSYAVKVRVQEASERLLPGMIADVRFTEQSEKPDSSSASPILIPANVLQLADDNSIFVWLDDGGRALRQTIVLGEYQSNGVVVKSGLKAGDRLIVEGQQKVCNGTMLSVATE